MHFERLRINEDIRYTKAMELYKISFPLHEQRKASSQAAIMNHDDYQFNLIYDETELVGIILCWETTDFIYVEHFCIFPEMRNHRYGQRALELLNQRGKTVILEIDPPVDEVSIHRKAFYERTGYVANDFGHMHPPYHEEYDGHKLIVMSYPARISEEEYKRFDSYLKNTVMA